MLAHNTANGAHNEDNSLKKHYVPGIRKRFFTLSLAISRALLAHTKRISVVIYVKKKYKQRVRSDERCVFLVYNIQSTYSS